ncbi:MAG: recombination mediator RecR [Firmicutes bacterium]|nr:recombination mediator RecR [Bacillota bacterium]
MMKHTDSIEMLIAKFQSLGGVGKKTAMRYAYKVVDMAQSEVDAFCHALQEVKQKVRYCEICGTFAESQKCEICSKRESDIICVVAYPKDVLSIEKGGCYQGLYHVLHGTISPLDGRGPNDLRIKPLLARLADCREVIVATNPDVEGEATALYLARIIKPLGVQVSRIAQGVSMGSDLEYVDDLTLSKALENRQSL